MKRTWISPLMLVALLLGSLGCSDLVGSNVDDEVAAVADVSLDRPLPGVALVVEGSNLCFTTQRCVGWCEWEDRDDCPPTWCVKGPGGPADPPPADPPDNRALTLGARGPSCALVAGPGLFDLQGRIGVTSALEGTGSMLFVPIAAVERLAGSGARCVPIQETTCPCWCDWDDRNDDTKCLPGCCVSGSGGPADPPPADPDRFLTGTPFGFSVLAPDPVASKQCAGWCDWEDRDDCPSTWCVSQPPDDSPPPPREMVVTLAGRLCYADGIQGGDDGPPYGGGGGPPNPPPPGAVARLASAAPGTVCVSIQDGDDGPPYGGGPGGPPPPGGNQ